MGWAQMHASPSAPSSSTIHSSGRKWVNEAEVNMGTFSSTLTEQNVLFDWILDIFPLSRTLHLKTLENNMASTAAMFFFLGLSSRISSSYELDNPECVYTGYLYIVCANMPSSKIGRCWFGLDSVSMINIPCLKKIFFRNWYSKCPADKHPVPHIFFYWSSQHQMLLQIIQMEPVCATRASVIHLAHLINQYVSDRSGNRTVSGRRGIAYFLPQQKMFIS